MIRQCENCGEEFKTKPSRVRAGKGKFCSQKCYYEWQRGRPKGTRTRVIKNCETCGKEFETFPSNIKRGWGRFCSLECRTACETKRVTKECEMCGKKFEVKRYIATATRFCSIECVSKWRETQTGESNGNWKGGKTHFICKNCGKEFESYDCARVHELTFCSIACYHSWHQQDRCYQWLGGISFEPYPPEFNEALKRQIRERDQRRCMLCGQKGRCVHHIDYDKDNCNHQNLCTVCRICHAYTNAERETWTKRLQSIMNEHYGYTYS